MTETLPARTTEAKPQPRTTDKPPAVRPQPAPVDVSVVPLHQLPTNRLWTADEVAWFLQIDTDRLSKMRVAGTGPAFERIDRTIRYWPNEVFKWLRRHRWKSTSEREHADAATQS